MKTNFKRLLAVVLSALLLVSSFAVVAFADDEVATAPAAENLAASATVVADGEEVTEITDGDIDTFYASEEAVKVGTYQYGNEIVLTLAERSFVGNVKISAYNWAPLKAATTFKVYVLVDDEWVYVATADMPADSDDEVITGAATFDAVMTDSVKVVAEAMGRRWMPQINEIEIYGEDLGADGFDDVADDDWYAAAVAYVNANGLMTGVDEVLFDPAGALSYAMMAQILYNMAGKPEVETDSTFADVELDAWYADAVAWAEANGIAAGNADGSFTPDAAIVRADIATYLYNYARYENVYTADRADLSAFEDVVDAATAMKWAVAVGLFEGRSETELAPDATATRAEVATLLNRFDLWLADADANYFRNVAVQGVASASSVRGTSFTADKAIDGKDSTYWQPLSEKDADGNFTGIATWTLKYEEAFDISRIVLTVANYRTWGTVGGVDYTIEGLVNGSWTVLATVNDADVYASSAKATINVVLDEAVTVTEIKVTGTVAVEEASYVKPAIYEIATMGAEAGMVEAPEVVYDDNAGDATITASTTMNSNYAPDKTVDDSLTSGWLPLAKKDADGNYEDAYILYDWGYTQHIKSISVLVNNYLTWGMESGVDYVVEARIGGQWVEVNAFNDADAADTLSGTVSFEIEFPALVPADAVRISGNVVSSSVKPKICDVEIVAWDHFVVNIEEITGITGNFTGGANAWSGGAAEILDDSLDSSAAWTVDSVLHLTFSSAATFDVLTIRATNHDPATPGAWDSVEDFVLNLEITYGDGEVETIKWSQCENSDNVTDSVIDVDIPMTVEDITSIKITTECAYRFYSYVYDISAYTVPNPVAVFEY
ncbi:MAG: S-layer homology domain-containing protein [Clostridia bacterium]|nr:S-layer homology domain-containing protein [Clostridia bacterium]